MSQNGLDMTLGERCEYLKNNSLLFSKIAETFINLGDR